MRRVLEVGGLLVLLVLAATGSAMAGTIGLVADDGCQTASSGAIFCDADIRPTGTGVFDPFLRVFRDGDQKDGTPDTYSSGWNTDANKQDWDDPAANDAGDAWTSALLASDIGFVTKDNQTYLLFTVDINQQGQPGDPASLLSLVNFELFNCTTNDYTSLDGCTRFFTAFDVEEFVDFNYRNHTGSGSGDIDVFVPIASFAQSFPSFQYIALRDGWGTPPGSNADNDGYQEWAGHIGVQDVADTPDNIDFVDQNDDIDVVPEPGMLALLGAGLAAAGARRRQRRS